MSVNRNEGVTTEMVTKNNGRRRRPIRVVSSLGEGKLVDRFQSAMGENQSKKKQREKGEKAYRTAKEKRDQNMAKFQEELDALLNDETPAVAKKGSNQIYVPRLTGTVKGKFEAIEQKKKKEEKARTESERQRRLERDMREKKRIELELSKKKLEGVISDSDDDVIQFKKKPGKILLDFEEMDRKRKEEKCRRIENERRLKVESEMKRFRAEKEKTNSESEESSEENDKEKKTLPGKLQTKFDQVVREQEGKQRRMVERRPKRLATSFTNFDVLEKERRSRERAKDLEKSQMLLQQETNSIKAAKATFKECITQSSGECSTNNSSSEYDENETLSGKKKYPKMKKRMEPSKLDSSKLKFDILQTERIENERMRIKEKRNQLLEEEKILFKNAKISIQDESEEDENDRNICITPSPQKLDISLVNFDKITKAKFSQEEKRIQEERRLLMELEIKLMEEEKNKLKNEQSEDDDEYQKHIVEKRKPKKLSRSFTEFDVLERQRKRDEEEKLYQVKAKFLAEERKSFKQERNEMELKNESDYTDDDIEVKSGINRSPKKLSSALTNFDKITREKVEKERLKAQEIRIRNLESEVQSFEEEKKMLQENVDDVTSGTKELIRLGRDSPRPRKLASSFTRFDMIEQQRREEEREKLHQEKMQKLQEERIRFLQAETRPHSDSDGDSCCKDNSVIPIQKMNIRNRMQLVMEAQEEAERKRIEETKFSRMTVEQQEMFLAKQRQIEFLKEQLASAQDESCSGESSEEYCYYYSDDSEEDESEADFENDDGEEEESSESEGNESLVSSDGTNSSGSYSGAPCFVETLKNLTVKEGDPVCFEATINANPHPKIIWYFKNRAIRNSSDYQYLNKGSQYSLYMNESFLDDTGEYMCKVTNSKGIATGKANLIVTEISDGE